MQKIKIKGMARTIVDVVSLQNREEMKKNKYGVQYSYNTIDMLYAIVVQCRDNPALKQHENRLIAWHEELNKIKKGGGKNEKDKNEKDPQKIIDYFRTKHTEAGNVPIQFNLDDIKLKYPHFSEQEIERIIEFQDAWGKFLEHINNANNLRKEPNNWQRILGLIGVFVGTAISASGAMWSYSVDVAKPVTAGNVGGGTTTDPTAVKPTNTDISTGDSQVGRGGSSESAMQQNNVSYNANETPDTTGASGTGTAPDASSGASANTGGGHEFIGQQQLLLIIGIVIVVIIPLICWYPEMQKQNEDENLDVEPLQTPKEIQDKINKLLTTVKSKIDIGNLIDEHKQNLTEIDCDDIRSVHSTREKGIDSKLGF